MVVSCDERLEIPEKRASQKRGVGTLSNMQRSQNDKRKRVGRYHSRSRGVRIVEFHLLSR